MDLRISIKQFYQEEISDNRTFASPSGPNLDAFGGCESNLSISFEFGGTRVHSSASRKKRVESGDKEVDPVS